MKTVVKTALDYFDKSCSYFLIIDFARFDVFSTEKKQTKPY